MKKKVISYLLILIAIPLAIIIGVKAFDGKQYAWISLCVCVIACIPFFLSFENSKSGTREMIIIAIMSALGVVGRIAFTPLPGFKPVTAIVILTAIYFGSEAGFMTGVLTAVISNFYFGQGPWTPFQMFAWGMTGLVAGIFAKHLKKNLIVEAIYGAFCGLLFSLLMDVWTVIWIDGTFNLPRYLTAISTSGSFTVIYAVSNAIFLLILGKPVGVILERVKLKYGIK